MSIAEQLTVEKNRFDVAKIRLDFPALAQKIRGKPWVYLDNGASSQTPQAVIDALVHFYTFDRANVHRGVHTVSQRATVSFEAARNKVASFIHAPHEDTCIFVRGTTEGINLVAGTWGASNIQAGDEVLVSELEHHSNIVPWQMLSKARGAKVIAIPVLDDASLDLDAYNKLLNERTKLVAFGHVSNSVGTIHPVKEMTRLAHEKGAVVVVDGAQAVPHLTIDVQDLDVDFYTFSAHKMCGPTGIGVIFGKAALLEKMPPWHGGGDMIDKVSFDGTTFATPPARFEAGTPNIADTIAFGAACDYLKALDWDAVTAHENALLALATDRLQGINGIRILGTAAEKAGVLSFVVEGVHPTDIGMLLDQHGIAVRTGHHCAQPAMERFEVNATVRASFAFYNTLDEVNVFADALEKSIDMLR
ncbi:MAG: cysteine desulfurase [Deltaproteobacteria bacterium]|nr:cysteine desulfurase [Deltaproteobacteria bacterium]